MVAGKQGTMRACIEEDPGRCNAQCWTKYLEESQEIHLTVQNYKALIPAFPNSKSSLLEGDWTLGYISVQISDFSNISFCSKILSLKLFRNL